MTKTILLASALLAAMSAIPVAAQTIAPAEQIRRATSALPAALRDGATVVSYDAKGAPQILRQGDNHIFCTDNSNAEGFNANCRGDAMRASADFQALERAQGKDAKALQADMDAAYASGKLKRPPVGTMTYQRSGKTEAEARSMWRMMVPNQTGESLAISTKRVNSSSPWIMYSGQAGAHIMMPQSASMDEMPPAPRPAAGGM
jgi:hypothetical protein